MNRITLILTYTMLFFASETHAWVINADFENGILGQKSKATNAFSGAKLYSVYSNSVVHSGSMSSEVGIAQGDTNNMGGSFYFPSSLGEGDEVWVRGYLYFPTGFDFTASGQGLKTLRIHVTTASGGNEGYHDVLIKNGITVGSEIGNPQFAPNNPVRNEIGAPIATGKWHAIEMYVKFSSNPGSGIYRVWRDGNLIFEDKLTHTLKSSSSRADFIYLFTYWNGGAPKTQKAYVDDFIITNQRPSNTDLYGNPFIGVSGTVSVISPPEPPSSIR